jgi:tRNA nucleotidyltransferase (CCA-adding enzyme)
MARPLLSQLTHSPGQPRLPLARALAGLSPATRTLLRAVAAESARRSWPLYLVGGFVRDLLIGRPNLDLDLVLEGDAIELGRALVKKLGGSLLPHRPFGTAVWTLPKKAGLPPFIDLISARRESYARPGALPEVQLSSIQDDLYRRDFSLNALALRLDGDGAGQLLDPWHGLPDLRAKRLRVLHSQSFSDDPTRILRGLRFAARMGFKIESSTLAQLKACAPLLELISGERIYKELELALLEPQRAAILQSMQRTGVLRAIHRGLRFDGRMAAALELAAPPASYWQLQPDPAELAFVLWLSQFTPAVASAVAQRLRFPSQLAAAAVSAARLRAEASKLGNLPASKLVPHLEAEPLLAIYALYILQHSKAMKTKLEKFAKNWRHIQPTIDGNALAKRGLKPGPQYSRILAALRAAWLDGKVKNKAQERKLLENLLHEQH